MDYLNENWPEIGSSLMHFDEATSEENYAELSEVIKSYYLGDREFSTEVNTVKAMIQMFGDGTITPYSEKAAILQAQVAQSPVKFFKYSCSSSTGSVSPKSDFGIH